MLSCCCLCTRDYRAPLIRLGDGSLLPISSVPSKAVGSQHVLLVRWASPSWALRSGLPGTMPKFLDSCKSISGKKKEPKPNLFGPDIFGWGGGLPREGVGAKKFGMSFKTQGICQTFWRDIPGFWRDIPGAPEKCDKKRFLFNSRSLKS